MRVRARSNLDLGDGRLLSGFRHSPLGGGASTQGMEGEGRANVCAVKGGEAVGKPLPCGDMAGRSRVFMPHIADGSCIYEEFLNAAPA